MTHQFIVNTDDINEYGYRVLTEGIDYAQYMRNPVVLFQHERFTNDNKGSEVIGRCLKLTKQNNQLIAEVEFDDKDEFAQKIAGKVERGYIRMMSMYADVKATSIAPEHVLPEQTLETVTACKLVELSVVDIGGNDAALKLSRNGHALSLRKIEQKKEDKNMSLKTIALALGLEADAEENSILNAIKKVSLAKTTAETERDALKTALAAQEDQEATALVDKAVQLGLLPEALKASQLVAFKSDFGSQKVTLSKLIDEQETAERKAGKVTTVKNFMQKAGTAGAVGAEGAKKGDFLALSKDNPQELIRLRRDEPETFNALFKAEYGTEPNN